MTTITCVLVDRRRNGTATVGGGDGVGGGGGGGEDFKRQHRSCFRALGSLLLQQRSTTATVGTSQDDYSLGTRPSYVNGRVLGRRNTPMLLGLQF